MTKFLKITFIFCCAAALIFGLGRLYFALTDGFMEKNVLSARSYDPRWDIDPLNPEEAEQVKQILDQKFTYLGKGCQSYVFMSADQRYVIKFFKYQRFRPQLWLHYLTFLPGMEVYLQKKIDFKQQKLERLYQSWKLAYDHLKKETGIVYVHLNKTHMLNTKTHFIDKLGLPHEFDMDSMEFLIQKTVKMICPAINELMQQKEEKKVKQLLVSLVDMILSEYHRGLADKDHALMQNTGFDQAWNPIHVDVGLFASDEKVKNPPIYKHELFSKTYKFRIWLKKKHPEIERFLTQHLLTLIGPEMRTMIPKLVTLDEGIDESPISIPQSR